jgi:hypothetical protein
MKSVHLVGVIKEMSNIRNCKEWNASIYVKNAVTNYFRYIQQFKNNNEERFTIFTLEQET